MICGNCKKQCREGANFCPNCGSKLEVAEKTTENKIDNDGLNKKTENTIIERINKHKKYIFIFLLIIGFAAVLFQVFFNDADKLSKVHKLNNLGDFEDGDKRDSASDKNRESDKNEKSNKDDESNYEFVTQSISVFNGTDNTIYVLDPENHVHTIQGEITSEAYDQYYGGVIESINGSSVSFIAVNDNNRALWYVTGQEMVKVADNVHTRYMSDDGKTIAYITGAGDWISISEGTLWIYNCETGETSKISEDIRPTGYIVSPDGKTVAYVKNYHNENEEFEAHIWENGKNAKFGDNVIIIALSNNNEYIYYERFHGNVNSDVDVCVQSKKGTSVLLSSVHGDLRKGTGTVFNELKFNKDYSQIIYNVGDKSYISVRGNERQILCDERVENIIIPQNTPCQFLSHEAMGIYSIYGVKSFGNTVIATAPDNSLDVNVKYIDGDFKAKEVFDKADVVKISKDGNVIICTDNSGEIIRARVLEDSSFIFEGVDKGHRIIRILLLDDADKMYYLDYSGNLWFEHKGEIKRVARNVHYNRIYCDAENELLFYTSNHENLYDHVLYYYSRDMEEPKRIGDIMNITHIGRSSNKIVLYVLNENENLDIYLGDHKTGFKKIIGDLDYS